LLFEFVGYSPQDYVEGHALVAIRIIGYAREVPQPREGVKTSGNAIPIPGFRGFTPRWRAFVGNPLLQ
jgi:hypothetical protein